MKAILVTISKVLAYGIIILMGELFGWIDITLDDSNLSIDTTVIFLFIGYFVFGAFLTGFINAALEDMFGLKEGSNKSTRTPR